MPRHLLNKEKNMKTNKILFTINPHSFVDVITNSSSELFTGKSGSKEDLEELIKMVYPNYLHEYLPLKGIEELEDEYLEVYICYRYETWSNSQQKNIHKLIPGFTKDEMFEKRKWGINLKEDFVNENTRERIINGIDPERKMYFLFSIDDSFPSSGEE